MRKRSKKCLKMHVECTKRERRMSILLSDEEQLIVDRYLEKYKITNKSRWLRETQFSCLFIRIWKKIIPPFLVNMI